MMHIEIVVAGAALRAHIGRAFAIRAKEFAADFAALAARTDFASTTRTLRHFGLLPEGYPLIFLF